MVRIRFGEKYSGPGAADPKKSREEREAELRQMMQTEEGRNVILLLCHEARGVPLGTMLPIGTPMSMMINDILKAEYPEA